MPFTVILLDNVIHLSEQAFYITSVENYKKTLNTNECEQIFNERMPLIIKDEYKRIIQNVNEKLENFKAEYERDTERIINQQLEHESRKLMERFHDLIDMASVYSHKIEMDQNHIREIERIVNQQIQLIIERECSNIVTRVNDLVNLTKYLRQ